MRYYLLFITFCISYNTMAGLRGNVLFGGKNSPEYWNRIVNESRLVRPVGDPYDDVVILPAETPGYGDNKPKNLTLEEINSRFNSGPTREEYLNILYDWLYAPGKWRSKADSTLASIVSLHTNDDSYSRNHVKNVDMLASDAILSLNRPYKELDAFFFTFFAPNTSGYKQIGNLYEVATVNDLRDRLTKLIVDQIAMIGKDTEPTTDFKIQERNRMNRRKFIKNFLVNQRSSSEDAKLYASSTGQKWADAYLFNYHEEITKLVYSWVSNSKGKVIADILPRLHKEAEEFKEGSSLVPQFIRDTGDYELKTYLMSENFDKFLTKENLEGYLLVWKAGQIGPKKYFQSTQCIKRYAK